MHKPERKSELLSIREQSRLEGPESYSVSPALSLTLIHSAEKDAVVVQEQDTIFHEELVKELKQFMMSADLDTITTRQVPRPEWVMMTASLLGADPCGSGGQDWGAAEGTSQFHR